MSAPVRTGPWTVLMVCTGNLCRSPLAQYLAAAYFPARRGTPASAGVPEQLAIASAGVHARADDTMHRHSAELLQARGIDPTGFHSRRLTTELVERSDLVLCATRDHRSAVVTRSPRALRRTFTLREFARLTSAVRLADLPIGPVRPAGELLVAAALSARAAGRVVPAELDDLTDPLGAGRARFEACASMIDDALNGPMSLLAQACQVWQTGPPPDGMLPAPRHGEGGDRPKVIRYGAEVG
ncbi:protein-tyrosine-phosphatase [Frankia sp. R82]|uniref:arsenate reductase/protein-tyrosine-phosphatase family protein n=1 Tax=Frankia sp. R82 TaxID=2950553 RepID=UPI002043988F|nr:protein-tyrosine-phosphatase [Frankia sp. R82]MCM3884759.1 protein-tyrosine-phosphatase [Frankia sp. R82]